MTVEFTVDQRALQDLARALAAESDGKKLKRELAKNLRKAIEPALGEIRSSLLAMQTEGVIPTEGGPLRTEILKHLKAETRTRGRQTGVRVRIKKRGPRGFTLAARRLNRDRGWRHPVFGNDKIWVRQIGKPGYFEDPIKENKAQYRAAILDAMQEMSRRIARTAQTRG